MAKKGLLYYDTMGSNQCGIETKKGELCMKKLIINLLLCLFSIGIVFTLCACNEQNEDNTKAPSWAEEENECQHKEWKLVGSLEPTCENEGYKRLECLECKESKLILLPQEHCDYEVSWEWGSQAHTTIIRFKCPRTNAHNQVKTAFQQSSTVIKEATCQEYGERLCYASVRDKYGRIHTAEKIEKFKVGCSMTEEIVKPETCYGVGKRIRKCQWCGKEKISSFYDKHTAMEEVERYNLADYGACGGELVKYECQCGYNEKIEYLHTCKNMSITENSVFDESGAQHMTYSQFCNDCGLLIEEQWTDIAPPCKEIKNHKKMVKINEDVLFKFDIKAENTTPHQLTKTTIHLNDICGQGYEEPMLTYQRNIVTVKSCACGKYEEIFLNWDTLRNHYHGSITINSPTFTEIEVSQFLHEDIISYNDKKAYTYECGLVVFQGSLIVSTKVGDCMFDFITVRHNDTIICQSTINNVKIIIDDSPDFGGSLVYRYATEEEKLVLKNHLKTIMPNEDFDISVDLKEPDAPTPDIPDEPDIPEEPSVPDIWEDMGEDHITDEDRKRITLEYLKELLESDTADLTEEQRAQYEEAVKQLEEELGIAEDIV